MSASKILVYDIETAFNIGGYFGPKYDANIAKLIQASYVFGFAWKWKHEKSIQSCYIWDFPRYQKEPNNDIDVIKQWQKLMLDADIIVGHNSDAFDTKIMIARSLVHKLPPIALPQSVDTWKLAKRVARFDSNKLDDLGSYLGLGNKLPTNVSLWWDCMQGDKKAQAKMVRYNKQDVKLTDEVYDRLLPYDQRHPNRAVIEGRPDICPRCGAEGTLVGAGTRHTKTVTYRRFQCKSCLSWVQGRLSEKVERPNYY